MGLDKEVVCFENVEEMVDKITYYLNHDEERRAIVQAGWERATGEYTSFHMISKVFDEIEKDIAAGDRKSRSQELEMPMRIRKLHARYHFGWGRALLEENCKGLWKDELELSLSYNPFNIGAWCYYIIGFFPSFMRPALTRLYGALSHGLTSIPYLSKMKQSLTKRLFHT